MSEQPKIVTERELDNEPGHEIMNVTPRCERTIRTFAAYIDHLRQCGYCAESLEDCDTGHKIIETMEQYHG
jgi:hypothetical protein